MCYMLYIISSDRSFRDNKYFSQIYKIYICIFLVVDLAHE